MKKCAAFTIAKNESFYLPVWLEYYAKHFDVADLYVLDHESTDGSTSGLSCQVRTIHNELYFDHSWLVEQVKTMQADLLREYESVLFCESDEMIVPDLRRYPAGLKQYVAEFSGDAVCCAGYDLIHLPDREPPLRRGEPLLRQRSFWFPSAQFSKPVLSREVLDYSVGFHMASNGTVQDPELLLVHLHRVDRGYFEERHAWKRAQAFKDDGPRVGWHHHASGDELDDYYFKGPRGDAVVSETPEWIRDAF